jgi:hypothetical protein
MLKKLKNLMNTDGNFNTYRIILKQSMNGCVPFIGVFITDLTFCKNAMEKYLLGTENWNFKRLEKTAGILNDFKRFKARYGLIPVSDIQESIMNLIDSQDRDQDVSEERILVTTAGLF